MISGLVKKYHVYGAGHCLINKKQQQGFEGVTNSWGQFNAVCTVPGSQPSAPEENK